MVLATGGMGQVFSATTNPAVSTGDGVALALRAGAEVSDLEFVQFHPTVLWLGPDAEGQQPLVSEAVRGEGAHLVDADGDPLHGRRSTNSPNWRRATSSPRRSRAGCRRQGAEHMYLDARHFGAADVGAPLPDHPGRLPRPRHRPGHRARSRSPPPRTTPPAASAPTCAGARTVPGLYACGEVACTGVHGANRLASNSLLEGLVFAERIAADIAPAPPETASARGARPARAPDDARQHPLLAPEARFAVQRIMTAGAGVLRSRRVPRARRRRPAAAALEARDALAENGKTAEPGVDTWEATNLLCVARVLVAAARRREETRGCHWREDHAERDDAAWRRHIVVRLNPDRHARRTHHRHRRLPPDHPPSDSRLHAEQGRPPCPSRSPVQEQ